VLENLCLARRNKNVVLVGGIVERNGYLRYYMTLRPRHFRETYPGSLKGNSLAILDNGKGLIAESIAQNSAVLEDFEVLSTNVADFSDQFEILY